MIDFLHYLDLRFRIWLHMVLGPHDQPMTSDSEIKWLVAYMQRRNPNGTVSGRAKKR